MTTELIPGLNGDKIETIIPEVEIIQISDRLAAQIIERHPNEEIVLVGIAMGGLTGMADISHALARRGVMNVRQGFVVISSYDENQVSSRQPVVVFEYIPGGIDGAVAILVDGVFDTGHSVKTGLAHFTNRYNPTSLETLVYVVKDGKQEVEVTLDYIGKRVDGSYWVVGRGPDDSRQHYRHLPDVGTLVPSD